MQLCINDPEYRISGACAKKLWLCSLSWIFVPTFRCLFFIKKNKILAGKNFSSIFVLCIFASVKYGKIIYLNIRLNILHLWELNVVIMRKCHLQLRNKRCLHCLHWVLRKQGRPLICSRALTNVYDVCISKCKHE